jgi:predicted nucleic acid-binding protein
MIHLDTNYLIRALVPGTPQAAQLNTWIISGESIGICAMAWAEFLCGPVSAAQAAAAVAILGLVESVSSADASVAANLFNSSGRRRGSLADCIIAAVAMRFGASVATENRADFNPFAGLRLVP